MRVPRVEPAKPVSAEQRAQEREIYKMYEQQAGEVAQRSAGLSAGFRPDEPGAYFQDVYKSGQANRMPHEQIMGFMDEINDYNLDMAQGAAVALPSGLADLGYMAAAVLSNVGRAVQGQDMEWPEDMRDMPASSDWWLEQLGVSREDVSMATFVGMTAISPSKLANMDAAVVQKLFKTVKALRGGVVGTKLAQQSKAAELYEKGTDPMTIWRETGWTYSPKNDGKGVDWKFVLSDEKAKIRPNALQDNYSRQMAMWKTNAANQGVPYEEYVKKKFAGNGGTPFIQVTLGEVFEHEDLFALYPRARDLTIKINLEVTPQGVARWSDKPVGGAQASFDVLGGFPSSPGQVNVFSGTNIVQARSAILHEVQHYVQLSENWASYGASAGYTAMKVGNYRKADFYERIASGDTIMDADPDKLLEEAHRLWPDEWKKPHREQDARYKDVKKWIRGDEVPDEDDISYAIQSLAREVERAQNHLGMVRSDLDEWEFTELLSNADAGELSDMIATRYWMDGGEVEARFTEAFSHVPQATLDKLAHDPYAVATLLSDPVNIIQFRELIPELNFFRQAPKKSGDIIWEIKKPASGPFMRPLSEADEAGEMLTKDGWDKLTFKEKQELAAQAVKEDPSLLAKLIGRRSGDIPNA